MGRTQNLRAAAALAGILVLPGCLDLDLEVVIAADGSGSQKMHLGLSSRVVESVRTSSRALDASGRREDPLLVFDAAKVTKELESHGLVVREHRAYQEGSRQLVDVAATFGNFATLRASTLFGNEAEWFVLAGRNAGGVRVVFYPRGHRAWLEARQKAEELRRSPTAVQQQFFESQRRKFEGFDTSMRLELPGDVDYCSSNFTVDGARAVVARIETANIRSAADLVRALAPRFEVEFDGAGCTIERDAQDPGLQAASTDRR
ncbi:MAG: hypothetical protein KDB80_09360 [Planctomycetes bacterium]|nr:hypothetical protein [Planctomycetota bacterium]